MRRPHAFAIVIMIGAALGLFFASVSTYDFVQHLDRQVHSIHCSFAPGLTDSDAGATTGCQVTMMSPYSSVLRGSLWGGIPISLPAMSVFAFLLFLSIDLSISGRQDRRREVAFLALATALPVVASVVMGTISFVTLGTACKLCIGIYAASAISLTGGVLLWRRARGIVHTDEPQPKAPRKRGIPAPDLADLEEGEEPKWVAGAKFKDDIEHEAAPPVHLKRKTDPTGALSATRYVAIAFAIGLAVVVLPILVYVGATPDHGRFIGSCGSLADSEDRYGIMIPIDATPGRAESIEVLDPLCPACRAFEDRLETSGLGDKISRKIVLFPLDNACNWMVSEAVHPGACAVSEAVLCAGSGAQAVIDWAYRQQDAIKEASKKDPGAAASMVAQAFPNLKGCLGSTDVRSRLNKSLRWAVRNQLQVLTPQLFVNGVKLCDEDVDLGLDFALSRLIDGKLGVTPDKATVSDDEVREPAAAAPPATATPAKTPPAVGSAPPGTAAPGTAAPGTAAPGTAPRASAKPTADLDEPTDGPKAEPDSPMTDDDDDADKTEATGSPGNSSGDPATPSDTPPETKTIPETKSEPAPAPVEETP